MVFGVTHNLLWVLNRGFSFSLQIWKCLENQVAAGSVIWFLQNPAYQPSSSFTLNYFKNVFLNLMNIFSSFLFTAPPFLEKARKDFITVVFINDQFYSFATSFCLQWNSRSSIRNQQLYVLRIVPLFTRKALSIILTLLLCVIFKGSEGNSSLPFHLICW